MTNAPLSSSQQHLSLDDTECYLLYHRYFCKPPEQSLYIPPRLSSKILMLSILRFHATTLCYCFRRCCCSHKFHGHDSVLAGRPRHGFPEAQQGALLALGLYHHVYLLLQPVQIHRPLRQHSARFSILCNQAYFSQREGYLPICICLGCVAPLQTHHINSICCAPQLRP